MNYFLAKGFLLLLFIVLLILGERRFGHLKRRSVLERLPVFSAETVAHRETEHIRDRLPTRISAWLVAVIIVMAGVVAWWASR